jgi:hypothetical protein
VMPAIRPPKGLKIQPGRGDARGSLAQAPVVLR